MSRTTSNEEPKESRGGIGAALRVRVELWVVIVFMASLFTGQAVLVARFAGAGDHGRPPTEAVARPRAGLDMPSDRQW